MEPSDALHAFRRSLYECLHRRSDALFELTDAILTADAAVPSAAHLSLQASHRRGWGTLYAALRRGRIDAEALDSTAMVVRDAKRRGAGWLAGYADIGWSNRLGWYQGFRLLVAVSPKGVITGFGFSSASTADQPMAETFFAARKHPNSSRLSSVGRAAWGPYIADKGFEGAENHIRWLECYGARVIHPPKRNSRERSWPKRLRRWAAGIRQIVESVYEKLLNTFGLHRERPHEMSGARARLAARVALHNFCIWLNERLGRPRLAFADLLAW